VVVVVVDHTTQLSSKRQRALPTPVSSDTPFFVCLGGILASPAGRAAQPPLLVTAPPSAAAPEPSRKRRGEAEGTEPNPVPMPSSSGDHRLQVALDEAASRTDFSRWYEGGGLAFVDTSGILWTWKGTRWRRSS